MITHLFPNSIFAKPFINFINENFDEKEHLFLVYGKSKISNIDNKFNLIRINKSLGHVLKIVKEINKSDKVIIHGLFNNIIVIQLFIQPWVLKKSYWVVWGGDLYYFKLRNQNIKSKIYEYLRKRVIENFRGLITLVDNDYKVAKKFYKIEGKHYLGRYINPINIDLLNRINKNIKKDENVINIQIGNSADPSNNHLETFNLLTKYKDQNIKIFVPLSYGDKENAMMVKLHGENIFGSKFVSLTEFLEPEVYVEFLNSIDIAIFGNKRQQALGNILTLLYLGKKVYIRDDISTWDYLNNKLNIDIFSYSHIKKSNFNEFTRMPEASKQKNETKILNDIDPKQIKLLWGKIFNE